MSALYAVMGWPIAHSRSPAMHNAALRELSIPGCYVPWAVPPARLGQAVEAAAALGCGGFNVTLPHKAAVMAFLDEVDAPARAIGAVNTVIRDGSRWLGINTDAAGLSASLREAGVTLDGTRVVLVGAGGAARAAVVGLALAGAEAIAVAARRSDQARALCAELAPVCGKTRVSAIEFGTQLVQAQRSAGLFIQATSATLGQTPPGFVETLALGELPAGAAVCDLVYKPRITAVLERAAQLGLRPVDGLGMLLHQGALAFERWTARPAPLALMRRALTGEG